MVKFGGIPLGRMAAVTTVLAPPIGCLMYKHVSWEPAVQGKKRMATHQLTFWSMLGGGVLLMHRGGFFKATLPAWRKAMAYGAAGILGAAGFETGEWLGKTFFPKGGGDEAIAAPLNNAYRPAPYAQTHLPLFPPMAPIAAATGGPMPYYSTYAGLPHPLALQPQAWLA